MQSDTELANNPLVSVIVLNWNGRRCINQCLESLLKQDYENYEVLVIDNASSDGSPNIVKKKFPEVKLIVNKRNLGFAGGNNVGIKVARGDLIALFNNDALADPNWLSELVRVMMQSKKIGVVGGPIYYTEPNDVVWAVGGKMDFFTGVGWHIYQGEIVNGLMLKAVDTVDYIPGAALLIRRELIEKVGLLNEDYFVYNDDMDLCLNVERAGYICKIVKSALVWHMVSFSLKEKPLILYYYETRSSFYFCLNQLPIPFVLTSIFFQYIILTFFEILLFKRPIRYTVIKSKALIWNLQNIKNILRKRRRIKNLGKGTIKIRLKDFLKVAKRRALSRQYYW